MLKVPSFKYYPEYRVEAYQDDTQWWKFYLIPDYVSIRRDKNGHPVFLLIKYAFGDQDRAENKNLPRGGGFMVLDVEMSVPEADYKKIFDDLQTYVTAQWNQLKALANSAGHNVSGYRISSTHYLKQGARTASLSVDDLEMGLGTNHPASPPPDAPPK